MFHFENGEHVISLNTVREPFAVKSIKLVPIAETISYEEYLAEHGFVTKEQAVAWWKKRVKLNGGGTNGEGH